MGRTVSSAPGYAPDDDFDPRIDDFVSKERNYLHFDLPLREVDRRDFSLSEADILENSFWPLLGYVAEERRVRKDAGGNLVFKVKQRPIKFGSHRDAAILQYYAHSLSLDYELALAGTKFPTAVLAYRSKIGNNIDHSKSLFDEICLRKRCVAIAMDISGFFDNIRHDVLYTQLCKVRGTARLSAVDYKIFQRMTKFEWVESDALIERLGKAYGRAGRICYPKDFRRFVRQQKPSLVQRNTSDFGIPQGTPLSGVYANLSLLEFDDAMSEYTRNMGGSYRRYSDDIAFVLPASTDVTSFMEMVVDALQEIGLEISAAKTEVSQFDELGGKLNAERPFQYLGFTFDGQRTLLRQSSLANYYGKMNRGIRAKIRAAKNQGVDKDSIYMRELFKKYTHFGKNRNFPRYAYRASEVHGSPDIRMQVRRHMTIFKKMVRNAMLAIY